MRVLSDSRHPSLAPGGSAPGCFLCAVRLPPVGPATGRDPGSWQAASCHRSKSRFVATRGGPSTCHRSKSLLVATGRPATGQNPGSWQTAALPQVKIPVRGRTRRLLSLPQVKIPVRGRTRRPLSLPQVGIPVRGRAFTCHRPGFRTRSSQRHLIPHVTSQVFLSELRSDRTQLTKMAHVSIWEPVRNGATAARNV